MAAAEPPNVLRHLALANLGESSCHLATAHTNPEQSRDATPTLSSPELPCDPATVSSDTDRAETDRLAPQISTEVNEMEGLDRQVSANTTIHTRDNFEHRPCWEPRRRVMVEERDSLHSFHISANASLQMRVKNFVGSPKFDALIGVVIIMNSVTIAMEQTWTLEGKDTSVLDAADNAFLMIYILELLVRVYAFGMSVFVDSWILFDALLVVIGVVTNWILMPFLGSQLEALGMAMVLRVTRLLRLARTVRLLIKFRELWMLVRGLINSAATTLYTAVILFAIIFIFGSIGVELITKHELTDPVTGDPVFREIVGNYFPNLPYTMLTILQFATLDDIDSIYRPLIRKSPWLFPYFCAVILVVSIVLMNLVTAVVVNTALEAAMQDKELLAITEKARKKKLIQQVSNILARLDRDRTGLISKSDFLRVTDEDRGHLEKMVMIADPIEIFETLDASNTGVLTIQEFCDGIWQVATAQGSIEAKRTEKKVDSLTSQIEGLKSYIDNNHSKLFAAVRELREVVPQRQQGRASIAQSATSPTWVRELTQKITLEMDAIKSLLQEQIAQRGGTHLENGEFSQAPMEMSAVHVFLKEPLEPNIAGWTGSAPAFQDEAKYVADGNSHGRPDKEEVATCTLLETLLDMQSGSQLFKKQLEAAEGALISYLETFPEAPLRSAITNHARKFEMTPGRSQPSSCGPALSARPSSRIFAAGDRVVKTAM